MPSSRIRGIIENDVLPNFSSLFLQLEEGKAHDGSKLDLWLEDMLGEMQRSIQSHLADVFKEVGTNGTGGKMNPSKGIRPEPVRMPVQGQNWGKGRGLDSFFWSIFHSHIYLFVNNC